MKTGAEAIGQGRFEYAGSGSRNVMTIRNTHIKLVGAGYLFAGWHGTSQAICEALINGAAIRHSKFEQPGKIWEGFYVSNAVEEAVGYCVDKQSGLLRVYVKDAAIRHILAAATDINHVQALHQDVVHHQEGAGKYLISGPSSDGAETHEMVISKELLSETVVIPSLHNVRYAYGTGSLVASSEEQEVAHPDVTKRGTSF